MGYRTFHCLQCRSLPKIDLQGVVRSMTITGCSMREPKLSVSDRLQHDNNNIFGYLNQCTCSMTRAFSMLRSSEGSPSLFQMSCSLSVLRKCLRSNSDSCRYCIQSSRQLWRMSSDADDMYVMNAAASNTRIGSSFSCWVISPT